MSSKRATLELVDVENAPPQEGIAFTTVLQQIARVFTNQYVDSSNMNLALEILNLTITARCVKPTKESNERSLLQGGKQGDDMMMTTNRWPLVMMWNKTA